MYFIKQIAVLTALITFLFIHNPHADAQNYEAHQVLVLNGGPFSMDPADSSYGTLGSYDPGTAAYSHIDSFPASSATDLVIDNETAFVLADSLLLSYDLENNVRLEWRDDLHQAAALDVHNDFLVVTVRNPDTQRVSLYDKSDLSLIHHFENIPDEAGDLTVAGDYAYVLVPGGFMSTDGALAILNLNTQETDTIIDFGDTGEGLNQIVKTNDHLYISTFENRIIWLNVNDLEWDYYEHNTSIGPFAGVLNDLIYSGFGDHFGSFDIQDNEPAESSVIERNFVAAILDTAGQQFFFSETDFTVGNNKVIQYDLEGNPADSATLDIIPEVFAVHYREKDEDPGDPNYLRTELHAEITAYPNPASAFINVEHVGIQEIVDVNVFTLNGRAIDVPVSDSGNGRIELSVEHLPAGMYFMEVSADGALFRNKFIIE